MSKKQWRGVSVFNLLVFMLIFRLCMKSGWEKTAWFVILPFFFGLSILIGRRMKLSNNALPDDGRY